MPRRTPALERLRVSAPCHEDWEQMSGNDQVRFCSHCDKHVHNLSAMTRKQALRLVAVSNGRLCIRYLARPDGSINLAPPPALLQITRRASRFAAGAFTAALSFGASAVAQTPVAEDNQPVVATSPEAPATEPSTIISAQQVTDLPIGGRQVSVMMGAVAISLPSDPLVKAVQAGDARSVRALLARGHDVNVRDKAVDATPLMQAAENADAKMVRLLLRAGADPNRRNNAGQTALMRLDADATPELARLLLDAGARLDITDDNGRTALMIAAQADNVAVLDLLLDRGAQIDQTDESGMTALMIAAADDSAAAVARLLDRGADVNRQDESDQTALKHALDGEHPGVAELLRRRGATEPPKDEEQSEATADETAGGS